MKIGIDAGGTKTTASLFKESNILHTVEKKFGNPLIDYQKAINHIEEAILDLIEKESFSETIDSITIGSAGAESGGFIEDMTTHFENKFQTKVTIMSDLKLSHIATFNNKDGVLLIAGTGSSCLYRENNVFYQKGGWGHILGDEGSAYWIGLQLIKQLMSYFEQSELSKDAHLLIPSLLEIVPNKKKAIQLVYQSPKSEVAQLAMLTTTFKETDFVKELVQDGANYLANLINLSTKKTSSKTINIALEGSVINKNQDIQETFFNLLTQSGYQLNKIPTKKATYGALYF